MSRRSTPERLHEARREATRQRLMGEGELPDRAEALIAAWEVQAAQDGLDGDGRYWEAGWAWMLAQRRYGLPVVVAWSPDAVTPRRA